MVESPHQEQHQQEQCSKARLLAKPANAGFSFSDVDFVQMRRCQVKYGNFRRQDIYDFRIFCLHRWHF